MPTKANEIEKPVCPVCGSPLLKSGYCPKCHRKKDGTIAEGHGKRQISRDKSGKFTTNAEKRGKEETNDDISDNTPKGRNVADFSLQPDKRREDEYLCEGCGTPVHYLQRKCRKCGIYLDWRGSPAENDPEAVICPMCGAFCGYSEDNPSICPHCRYQG